MTQAATNPGPSMPAANDAPVVRDPKLASHPALRADNITLPKGATNGLSGFFIAIGVVALLITVLGGFAVSAKQAVGALHVGTMTALAASLGSLIFIMVFHIVNAGWTATVRRQFENIAAGIVVPIGFLILFMIIEFAGGGVLVQWIGLSYGDDYLLDKKSAFLNEPFWIIRGFCYMGLWAFIILTLRGWSLRQDDSGDPALTRKARFLSGWGLLALALTTAFASFDWLMALDFRFFSTMWGVWYFAGAATTAFSCVILILSVLYGTGRLQTCITKEHFHDLGKLLFGFTIFWAYISFSQYFLIWYSNIPEETIYFAIRQEDGWEAMFAFLAIGHFVAPFLILLIRVVKESAIGLSIAAAWMILMQVVDLAYVVRPLATQGSEGGAMTLWLDFAGAAAVLFIFAGVVIMRVGSSPLVAVNDPRMGEALAHKNYV
ncbi:MAG: hypothetical protein AAGK04_11720 [Planctomycetota bacterium]